MAFITNTDSSILPYNDNDMKYDLDRHMYILTKDGVEKNTGIDLNVEFDSEKEVEIFLLECSQDVYNFVFSYSLFQSIKLKKFFIAKDSELREDFKQALVAQARYMYRSSANLLKDMHGINIETNKLIELQNLRGDIGISSTSKSILSRTGLLYTGIIYTNDYEDDGTW